MGGKIKVKVSISPFCLNAYVSGANGILTLFDKYFVVVPEFEMYFIDVLGSIEQCPF